MIENVSTDEVNELWIKKNLFSSGLYQVYANPT